jgi:hypothetical protein
MKLFYVKQMIMLIISVKKFLIRILTERLKLTQVYTLQNFENEVKR